nr:reverse transcriptase domain-containing protein [Tanacetum cinerariifolium]
MTAHHNDWDTSAQRSESSSSITSSFDQEILALKAKMAKINKNLMRALQVNQQVKAVTPSCETCGGPHAYNDFPGTVGQTHNVYVAGAYQGGSGILPSNTITNPKEDLKGITTRSGNSYQGPTIPTTSSSLPKVVERETEVTKDTVPPTNNESTKDVQPSVVQVKTLIPNYEPVVAPVIEPVVAPIIVDFDADPQVPLILGRSFLNTEKALIDVYEGELTLRVGKEAITFNLDQTLRYSANYNDMMANRIDVIDMACEEYSQEVLDFSDVITIDDSYYDPEGDILLLESFLNDDPSLPPPNQEKYLPQVRKELKICKAKNDKSSIDKPPKVELKDLPPHLEYAFLEGDNKFPVIISKDLSVEEKAALIKVLKSHKQAIAWKLSDIKGINPEFYTHKILMEDDFEPAVQHQIMVNLKIHDVIKKEVLKLLNAGLIYHISDSPWVRPVYCVPKKGGFTVVENEENELILTRLVMGWRVCIDYHKLNEATRKDHFPLSFMDQMLERLAGNEYYCFLDGFSSYFQFPLILKINKRPHSRVLMQRFPTVACLLGYAMHRARSKEKMLQRCKDINLCLNWEQSHFMVKEGIVLGHKISKNRIEVDKAKVDVIGKLPHPTTVKGGVFMARKPLTFSRLATMDPLGDIMARTTPPRRFGTPRTIISDRETNFCNDQFANIMLKYGVTHRLATTYHLQTSGQVEVSNRGLKRILERTVGGNHASWSDKLDDALWAFCTTFKTPIGCTPYNLVYRKAVHLPIKLEHKAYWALKYANFNLQTAGDNRKVQLNKLNELRDQAYENSLIYKEKTKRILDSKIKDRVFNVNDQILLFNSRLKIFLGKLETHWSGPFTICNTPILVNIAAEANLGYYFIAHKSQS